MHQTTLGRDLSAYPQSPMWLPPYPQVVSVPPTNFHWEDYGDNIFGENDGNEGTEILGGNGEDDTTQILDQDDDGEGIVDLNGGDDNMDDE